VEVAGSRLKPILINTIAPPGRLGRARRISEIFRTLAEIFRQHRPSTVFLERAFFGKNAQSALAVGEARGMVAVAAGQVGAEIVDLSPMEAKKAVTGKGDADKILVRRMVERILDVKIEGQLDSSDAAALAVAGALRMGSVT